MNGLVTAYDDKSRQEEMIKASSLHRTIVRPDVLTKDRKTERYCVMSRAGVAHFIPRLLGERTPVGAAPNAPMAAVIGGPAPERAGSDPQLREIQGGRRGKAPFFGGTHSADW